MRMLKRLPLTLCLSCSNVLSLCVAQVHNSLLRCTGGAGRGGEEPHHRIRVTTSTLRATDFFIKSPLSGIFLWQQCHVEPNSLWHYVPQITSQ